MTCASTGLAIAVDDISWGPRTSLILIEKVSFSLAPGDRLAILGPNGAGKSTLMRCLYRAVRPHAGTVRIDGENIWTMPPRDLAQRVAVVLQEMPADFPFSVRDVVLMGRIPRRKGLSGWSDHDRSVTADAMERLDLSALAGRQFATLSGGEKQRVLVARALAQEPQLIILDEPTNHLDIRHQLEILDLLRGLGLTIVITLHDINLAAGFATHVALMQAGQMKAFGPPQQVLTPAAISSAFGIAAQQHAARDGHADRFSFALHDRHRAGLPW